MMVMLYDMMVYSDWRVNRLRIYVMMVTMHLEHTTHNVTHRHILIAPVYEYESANTHALLHASIGLQCSAGQWSYGNESSTKERCTDCPVGTYSNGAYPCEACPQLSFATSPGQQSW